MKIGDEVYIHGYIDEIRKDTIIIKNDGGYFGTIPSEIIDREQEPCKDDISRKAVLDTLDTADKFLDEDRTVERYKAILTDAYEVLPSVNPQEPKTEPCEGCISRVEALEQINCWIGSGEYRYTNATYYLTRRIKELSSINPIEPKTDILEQIRAEIDEQKKERCFDDMFEYITGLDDAIHIIDKYRREE